MELLILFLGLFFGTIIGASLFTEKLNRIKGINEVLRGTINDLEKELDISNNKVENRDKLIKDCQTDREILFNNAAELRAKIVDLENNIELLTNNLSNKNKALVSDCQSNN